MSLFESDEDEVLRVKVVLAAADYAQACDLHRDGKVIAVRGEISRGVKVHRLLNANGLKEFVP